MARATAYEHIVIGEAGVPVIDGTSVTVVELVLETVAYGRGPDELQFQHPHLTLGQIHSALAYYRDHKEELDHDVARRLERVEQGRSDSEIISRRHATLNREAEDALSFQGGVTRRAEEKLLHPPPGSRIEAARAYGVDLTLLVERLRLTPEERVRDLQQALRGLESMRGRARPTSETRLTSDSSGKSA